MNCFFIMKYLYLFVFILSLLFVKPVMAQYSSSYTTTSQTLSFGFELGAQIQEQYSGLYQFAPYQATVGFVSRFELPVVQDQFNITFATGVNMFVSNQTLRSILGRPNAFTEKIYAFVPLKAGGKYYFTDKLYATGEVGVVVNASNSFKITPLYTPGIGLTIPFMQTRALDLGIKYETWNQVDVYGETFIKSFFNASLVYKFGIGEGQ